jgi:hypothetical protein
MYPYRTCSESQLIELVNSIESILTPAIHSAKEASQSELQSQLAFEVGHLNGSIKGVVQLIEEYKECSNKWFY